MDPYLEGPRRPDFHNSLLVTLRAVLLRSVLPRYLVAVEERLVLVPVGGGQPIERVGDTVVSGPFDPDPIDESTGTVGGAAVAQPAVLTPPRSLVERQVYPSVLDRSSREAVTVIELLSPSNKGGDRHEYLRERDELIDAGVNLLEVDLLRGGRRLPTVEPLPPGDYHAFTTRSTDPTHVGVTTWGLRDRLPTLGVPLAAGDADVPLDLQPSFDRLYGDAAFGYALAYDRPPVPSLAAPDAAWVTERLAAAGVAGG